MSQRTKRRTIWGKNFNMANKQYDSPLEEVIGTVESCTLLRNGVTKEGERKGQPWQVFKVVINGDDSFETFDEAFQNEVGKEGSYKFSRNSWTDRSGGVHQGKL